MQWAEAFQFGLEACKSLENCVSSLAPSGFGLGHRLERWTRVAVSEQNRRTRCGSNAERLKCRNGTQAWRERRAGEHTRNVTHADIVINYGRNEGPVWQVAIGRSRWHCD